MSQELLTWPEAASRLDGWLKADAGDNEREAAGRRLRWAVMAREQQTGKRIATRLGLQGEGLEPKTRITMGALFRHLPELKRSNPDQLAANFRTYIAELDDRIGELAAEEIERTVQPQIAELHGKVHAAQETADVANANASRALHQIEQLTKRVLLLDDLRAKAGKRREHSGTDDQKP